MTDLEKAISNVPKVFEAGKQAEYEDFWDKYQNPPSWSFAFAGGAWTDETFNPKNDIVPVGWDGAQLFCQTRITDLEAILKRNGVKLDLSKCYSFNGTFAGSRLTVLPEIDMSSAQLVRAPFESCATLKTIRKLILSKNAAYQQGNFYLCNSLENIVIEGDYIVNVNFQYSPLNKASITSVIEHLSADVTGYTATFKQTAVDTAFETARGLADGSSSEEWLALVASKPNWTISLI